MNKHIYGITVGRVEPKIYSRCDTIIAIDCDYDTDSHEARTPTIICQKLAVLIQTREITGVVRLPERRPAAL